MGTEPSSLAGNILLLGNGYFLHQPVGLRLFAALGLAGLITAGLCFPIVATIRRLTKVHRKNSSNPSLVLYLAFWALTEIAICASFIFSTVALGTGHQAHRYIVPVFFAIAATAPLWTTRASWRQHATAGAVSAFCLLSIGRVGSLLSSENKPMVRNFPQVIRFLSSQGVIRGYTEYWNSHPMTYHSNARIHAYPVMECPKSPSNTLCPFPFNIRTTWYHPQKREGVKTFVITDSSLQVLKLRSPPPAEFGNPSMIRQFEEISVFVYDYDVASKFGRLNTNG